MDFPDLFAAIDVKPFRPFKIELVSGRQIDVTHPDNIMIAPTRQRVICIHVYQTDPYDVALIWPEGLVGILYPTAEAPPVS